MFPAINIGSFVFPTAGLLYILGAWVSLSLLERSAKRLELAPDPVYGTGAVTLFGALIGARLTFVAIYWAAFKDNLLGIVWPLNSGYNLWGGLVIGLAGGFFYARAKQLRPWETLDAVAPAVIVGLLFVSLADFVAGPGFGVPTRAPWGITQFSVRRHPVQLYEILVALVALVVWWRSAAYRQFPGQLFLLAASIYSGGRLLVDAFRQNALLTNDGYHLTQIVSLIVMLVCVYLLGKHSERFSSSGDPASG